MQNVGCLKDGSCPTSFPAPCALSAAWNTSLVHDMGGVIGRELRAYYNAEVHDSLDTWSPTINLNRDPVRFTHRPPTTRPGLAGLGQYRTDGCFVHFFFSDSLVGVVAVVVVVVAACFCLQRWGRNVESPGEDPLLCGMYGAAYTKGLQEGADPKVRQATVTLKHWVAYSIESYKGVTRHNVDVNVSAYDLANSYFPAWERTVKEGGAKGIMCSYVMVLLLPLLPLKLLRFVLKYLFLWSHLGVFTDTLPGPFSHIYSPRPRRRPLSLPLFFFFLSFFLSRYNMLNGKPTCGNPALAATLREDWGFTGYITSDSDSCADIYSPHNFAKSKEAAAAICLAGGTDIDSGGTYSGHLSAAVSEGLANRSLVDAALSNSYRMRFEMSLFDPHVPNAYRNITTAEVGSAANQAMSLRGARSAMVLLKNAGAEDGKADGREAAPTLPFATGIKVAVIGRVADDANSLTGNYDGPLCPQGGASCWPSICAAVSEQVGRGGNATCTAGKASTKDAAVAAARAADAVVFVADNAADGGGEGHDRETIGLSSDQREVAEALFALKKPAVLVLVNGGMISIDGLKDSAPAILETFMPGVHGAQAIAETIFGANVPGGKLPVTMYPSDYVDKVDFLSMDMSAGPGRSYRYYTGTPTYPFGFGLSYTTFSMAWSPQPPSGFLETSEAAPAKYSVVVKNTGTKFAGDEVVQLYIKPDAASRPAGTPVEQKRLVAFERVHLSPGEAKTVTFEVAPEDFALVDADGHKAFRYGHFDVIASRGHGDELVARIATSRPGAAPARLSTLRKWW